MCAQFTIEIFLHQLEGRPPPLATPMAAAEVVQFVFRLHVANHLALEAPATCCFRWPAFRCNLISNDVCYHGNLLPGNRRVIVRKLSQETAKILCDKMATQCIGTWGEICFEAPIVCS